MIQMNTSGRRKPQDVLTGLDLGTVTEVGDAMTVEVTTKAVDSIFPYQMLWFLVSSPAQYEKLGRSWEKFAFEPSGTG